MSKAEEDALQAAAASSETAGSPGKRSPKKPEVEPETGSPKKKPSGKTPPVTKRPGANEKGVPKGKAKASSKSKMKRPAAKSEVNEAEATAVEQTDVQQPKEKKQKNRAKQADEEKAAKLMEGVSVDGESSLEKEMEEPAKRCAKKAYFFHKHFAKLPEQAGDGGFGSIKLVYLFHCPVSGT